MSEGFRVAVLGATGLVGQQMIEILQQRKFPVSQLFPLASARSAGATVKFGGEDIEVLNAEEFEKMKIHTVVGAEIVEGMEFPYPVAPIVPLTSIVPALAPEPRRRAVALLS